MSSSTVSLVRLHSMHLGRSVGGGTRLATRSSISSPLRTSLSTSTSTSSRIRIASSTASKARAFSSSSATSFTHTATNNNNNKMAPSTQTLIEVAKARRSYYVLGRNSPVPDSEILELVNQAILHIPSSFNTQSTRLVVALHGDHEKVWDIAADSFKSLIASGAVTQETFDTQTKPKLDLFKGAYGTILFYEDPAHVKPYAEKFPAFGDKFPQWAEHSNAMHQWFLWAGLESLGFGANLQHYNPLIDAALAKTFDVPSDWDLKAQLVFGSIEAPANEKQFKPTEERVKVFGAQL